MRIRTALIALLVAVGVLPALPAGAGVGPQTLYVDDGPALCSDGTVDSTILPYCNIEAAVDDALAGDTIQVAPGLYFDHDVDDAVVAVDKTLTIQGAGADFTEINGGSVNGGLLISAPDVVVQGVSITDGGGDTFGGVRVEGGAGLTLRDSEVKDSIYDTGAGILVIETGSLFLERVAIDDNFAATAGGAIRLNAPSAAGSSITIVDSTFDNNTSPVGGAIEITGTFAGTLDIMHSLFSSNDASTRGGAFSLTNDAFTYTITSSTIEGNGDDYQLTLVNVTDGGGLYSTGGTLLIENSLFTDNEAFNGAGMLTTQQTVTVRNSTFSQNVANTAGGAMHSFAGTAENVTVAFNSTAGYVGGVLGNVGTPPSFQNSIIAQNSDNTGAPDCNGFVSGGYNLIQTTAGCTITGDDTGNLLGPDPLLESLSANGGPTETHGFLEGAPPHNHGNPLAPGSGGAACLATDQRGVDRNAGQCDIGAFELNVQAVRLSGTNRYGTAAAISQHFWPEADDVIIANGSGFPDALTGSNLYGVDAPLLLVTRDSIPAATVAELNRLAPDDIYILGGTAVVSAAVEVQLSAWGPVVRLSGSNRYGTAVAITGEAFPLGVTTLLVASGTNFPDALAGGAVAARTGGALLITDPNSLPGVISAEITRLSPTNIHVLGGPAAVSATVFGQLQALAPSVQRISGGNRYDTAVAISQAFYPTAAKVLVSTGVNFPDALAGSLAAGIATPILLIPGTSVPAAVANEITRLGATSVFVLGGTAVISAGAFTTLAALVGL